MSLSCSAVVRAGPSGTLWWTTPSSWPPWITQKVRESLAPLSHGLTWRLVQIFLPLRNCSVLSVAQRVAERSVRRPRLDFAAPPAASRGKDTCAGEPEHQGAKRAGSAGGSPLLSLLLLLQCSPVLKCSAAAQQVLTAGPRDQQLPGDDHTALSILGLDQPVFSEQVRS